MTKIRVMLADDQTIIREGLKTLLSSFEDIQVICDVPDGKSATVAAEKENPDVILMDIRMPLMDGVEATRIIREKNKNIKIIILTTFDDDDYIINAMSNGASGYLLKDTDSKSIAEAIRNVLAGNIIMPGAVFSKFSRISRSEEREKPLSEKQNAGKEIFTPRENDIINLLLEGKTNREISETLYLSVGTTKNYISQIYMKLGVTDRSNAIIELKKSGY